ncbi:hypothetical protein SAMN05192568_10979 [Methylobacterium pseudosasicola]|uniref:Uncharacterized protein n=1 Tax=Methylobacterium pseudosasicola TaxID=582667 RepID=A0A1I4VF55_9HYPH|nr:hypothetical protein SAMN05192568_10979 [Methylobacterium pseudosasicola]
MLEGSANGTFSTLTRWVEKGGERGDKTFSTTTPYRVGGGGGGGSPQGGGGEPPQSASEALILPSDPNAGSAGISSLLDSCAVAQCHRDDGRHSVDGLSAILGVIAGDAQPQSAVGVLPIRKVAIQPISENFDGARVVLIKIPSTAMVFYCGILSTAVCGQQIHWTRASSSDNEIERFGDHSIDKRHRSLRNRQRMTQLISVRDTDPGYAAARSGP